MMLAENTLSLNLEDKGFILLGRVLNNSLTKKALLNTAYVSILTSVLSVVIATPLAWVLSRIKIRYSKKWLTLFSIPYAIPHLWVQ